MILLLYCLLALLSLPVTQKLALLFLLLHHWNSPQSFPWQQQQASSLVKLQASSLVKQLQAYLLLQSQSRCLKTPPLPSSWSRSLLGASYLQLWLCPQPQKTHHQNHLRYYPLHYLQCQTSSSWQVGHLHCPSQLSFEEERCLRNVELPPSVLQSHREQRHL